MNNSDNGLLEAIYPRHSLVGFGDGDQQALGALTSFMRQNVSEIVRDFANKLREHQILTDGIGSIGLTQEGIVAREHQHLLELTTFSHIGEYLAARMQEINVYQQSEFALELYLTLRSLIVQSLYTMLVQKYWWQPKRLIDALLAINKLHELDRQLAINLYTRTLGDHLQNLVGDIIKSTEQLSRAARLIANNSQVVSLNVEAILQAAQEGYEHVGQTIDGNEHIQRRIAELSDRITELSQRVVEISTVIDLIKEVIDETDILAINASVEAAGAGEVGRRFSVVAGEIRRLADRVRQSAGQIETLIYEVQSAARSAVVAADVSVRQSREGVELAHRAGSAVSQVVDNIQDSTAAVLEISTATDEQGQVSTEVAAAMREIARAAAQLAAIHG